MILTEERTSTIEFRSRFKHIDYFKNSKVIVVALTSASLISDARALV